MIRRITRDQPLKILSFTDTHLDGQESACCWTMRLLSETIQSERPDLVLFLGDNVTGGLNRERLDAFTQLLTQLQTPWCAILGNHEGDNPYSESRSEMARSFRRSPFCLITPRPACLADGTNVFGELNYAIPLFNEQGRICHKLIFLDSGAEMAAGDRKKYGPEGHAEAVDDFLKQSQIDWYREQVRQDDCPSMVFSHIPLPEFRDACCAGKVLVGSQRESISAPQHNSGMLDAMIEEGKSIAFVAGHDHVNDFWALYQGVYLLYNRMSGLSSYNVISKKMGDKLIQGASVFYIDAEGRVGFGDVFYEDRFPYYQSEIYAVIRK